MVILLFFTKHIRSRFLLVAVVSMQSLWGQLQPTPQQVAQSRNQLLDDAHASAAVLFNPVKPGSQPPQPNPYSTKSLNEAAINATFGPQGLQCDATLITYIKNFYFFLEYVTRVECAARLISLARSRGIDFQTKIEQSWSAFVTTMISTVGSWKQVEDLLVNPTLIPSWQECRSSIGAQSWQQLATSDFFTSIPLTSASLQRFSAWQNYLRYAITHNFEQDQQNLGRIHLVEQTIFKYLPNLEVAYYDPDFTHLRNASEMLHMSLLLNDRYRRRLVQQANDWLLLASNQLYKATQSFAQSMYYMIASTSDNPLAVYTAMASKKLPGSLSQSAIVQAAQDDPSLLDQLIVLAMIKNLHALINYFYDKDHLEKTMAVLASGAISKPTPSLFLYTPDDYLLLDDIAHLHDTFQHVAAQPKQTSLPTQVCQDQSASLQFSLGDLWDDTKDAIKKGWKDVAGATKAAVSDIEDAGKQLANEARAVGFGSAAVFIAGFDTLKAKDLIQKAQELKNRISSDIHTGMQDLHNVVNQALSTVNDAIDTAKDAAQKAAGWAGGMVTKGCDTFINDKEFCTAAGKTFETLTDMGITILTQEARILVVDGGGVLRLATDAVGAIANITADLVTGNYQDLGQDLVQGLKTMAQDAAATILETLSFSLQYFMEQLINAFKLVSYFISMLTRIFIDITTVVTYSITSLAQSLGAPINAGAITQSLNEALSSHESTIGAAITTGLLLATIPLTGGASTPLVIMGLVAIVGPQLFSVYGSYQEDEQRNQQISEEKDFVANYRTYVNQNKLIYQQEQSAYTAELQAKYQAEISNQNRGLGFLQNSTNANFESIKEQTALLLGNYWADLLTPSKDGLSSADLGSVYGFSTGVYDLNPSQGFSLYNAARSSFSQEIAAAAAVALEQQDQSTDSTISQQWFNQRQTALLPSPTDTVHIRFQGIYTLNTFFIGLYCGKEINIQNIIATKKAPLDPQHLAVMIVFSQEGAQAPIQLRLYEHEGAGWLSKLQGPPFAIGTWYHIKATMQGNAIRCKIWAEPQEEPTSWQSFGRVGSNTWQTIGLITSGVAAEYQFIEPTVTIKPNLSLRPANSYCQIPCDPNQPHLIPLTLEADRQIEARKLFNYVQNPQLSAQTTLQAIDPITIMKGNYLYRMQTPAISTAKDGSFVVPAQLKTDFQLNVSLVPNSLGISPRSLFNQQTTPAVVSLVSQQSYTLDGKTAHLYCQNVTEEYIKARPSLSDQVSSNIRQARQTYLQALKAVTFGQFSLHAASDQDVAGNRFIYTMPLLGPDGKNINNDQANPLTDYLIFALVDTTNNTLISQRGNPGISYYDMLSSPSNQQGLISLVSGNIYLAASLKPIVSGYRPAQLLNTFTTLYGALSPTITQAINQAQNKYQQIVSQQPTQNLPAASGTASNTISNNDIANPQSQSSASTGTSLPPKPKPAEASLQKRTEAASNDDTAGF